MPLGTWFRVWTSDSTRGKIDLMVNLAVFIASLLYVMVDSSLRVIVFYQKHATYNDSSYKPIDGDHLSWYVTRTFWSGVVVKWNFRTWEKLLCEFMEIASGKIPRTEEIDIPNPNLIYLYKILYPNRYPLEVLFYKSFNSRGTNFVLWAKI